MNPRLLPAAASVLAALAVAPATSVAAGPAGGCPRGFALIPLEHAPFLAPLDRNGDGQLCSKPLPNFPSQPAFEVIDNDVVAAAQTR